MSRIFSRMGLAAMMLAMVLATSGCEKEPVDVYYYNLYTDVQNLNQSNFDAFDPMWDVPQTSSYRGTRAECDARAVKVFEDMIELIDDAAACAGLKGDDYVSAKMQRVEGGPNDLVGKSWRSTGTSSFGVGNE